MINPEDLLRKRLGEGRYRQVERAIKSQKLLDTAPRAAQYQGFQINNGAIIRTVGDGVRAVAPVSNGLVAPGDIVKIQSGSFDFMPKTSFAIEEDEKPKYWFFLAKEVVGSQVPAASFEINVEIKSKSTLSAKKRLAFIADVEAAKRDINRANAKFFQAVKKEYKPIEEIQLEHYSVFSNIKEAKNRRDFSAYICNCHPRIIHSFISQGSTFQDLSIFFKNSQSTFKRTPCSSFRKKPTDADDERCLNAIPWRLVEVGFHGSSEVVYASGIVTELGMLKILNIRGLLNPDTYVFASTYDYPGYMQIQSGCNYEGAIRWKST